MRAEIRASFLMYMNVMHILIRPSVRTHVYLKRKKGVFSTGSKPIGARNVRIPEKEQTAAAVMHLEVGTT